MVINFSRAFLRSNSPILLRRRQALQSSVVRLDPLEELFMVDSGRGKPRICTRDELATPPTTGQSRRFRNVPRSLKNKVSFLTGGDSPTGKMEYSERTSGRASSVNCSRSSFPRSNSSFLLCRGQALQSSVVRVGPKDELFMVDSGRGKPQMCTRDELAAPQKAGQSGMFEDKVGFLTAAAGGEAPMGRRILERIFVDLIVGDPVTKARAVAKFQGKLGAVDVGSGEQMLLPQRYRQNRAATELQKMYRRNKDAGGFILSRVRGGYAAGVAGFVTFSPIIRSNRFSVRGMFGMGDWRRVF